jgi:hypothetical protein
MIEYQQIRRFSCHDRQGTIGYYPAACKVRAIGCLRHGNVFPLAERSDFAARNHNDGILDRRRTVPRHKSRTDQNFQSVVWAGNACVPARPEQQKTEEREEWLLHLKPQYRTRAARGDLLMIGWLRRIEE